MIDTKEIRKALAIHGVDVLNEDEVLDVLDHLEAAYKEIESWKGLARQFGNEADELRTHLSFAKDELNRLRAKIAEMEKQEPAGIAGSMPGTSGFTMACFSADEVPMGTKLYALPGAQPAPSVPDGFSREDLEAVADGLDGYEKTVNVGNVTGEGDDHLESTTAYAARFIRAMLAAPEAKI